MLSSIWFSIFLGAGLAALYAAAALIAGKIAMRSPSSRFMLLVMGGMTIRIFVTIIILTLVLLFAPVDQTLFLIAFFAVFVLGLILEVLYLHRKQKDISIADASRLGNDAQSEADAEPK